MRNDRTSGYSHNVHYSVISRGFSNPGRTVRQCINICVVYLYTTRQRYYTALCRWDVYIHVHDTALTMLQICLLCSRVDYPHQARTTPTVAGTDNTICPVAGCAVDTRARTSASYRINTSDAQLLQTPLTVKSASARLRFEALRRSCVSSFRHRDSPQRRDSAGCARTIDEMFFDFAHRARHHRRHSAAFAKHNSNRTPIIYAQYVTPFIMPFNYQIISIRPLYMSHCSAHTFPLSFWLFSTFPRRFITFQYSFYIHSWSNWGYKFR